MKIYKKFKIALGLLLITLLIILLNANSIWFGYKKASSHCKSCDKTIQRKWYPFRHWQWSGIFPIYGSFIDDPHFSCSNFAKAPESLVNAVKYKSLKYQVVYVNPFFHDETSENLLILITSKNTYEFNLNTNGIYGSAAVTPNQFPQIRMFPYKKNTIAVLAHLLNDVHGFYIIQLPLKDNTSLQLYTNGSNEYKEIVDYFKRAVFDRDINDHFCQKSNAFITFYINYRKACNGLNMKEYLSANPHAVFTNFWKTTKK